MLLALAGVAWVHDVDWAHWQASARDLGPSHPTGARVYGAVASAGTSAAMPLAAIRAAHGPLLERASDRRVSAGAVGGVAVAAARVAVGSPAPTGYTAISGGPTPRSSATTNAIALEPMAWPEAGAPGRVPSTRMTAAIQVKGRYQRLFPPPIFIAVVLGLAMSRLGPVAKLELFDRLGRQASNCQVLSFLRTFRPRLSPAIGDHGRPSGRGGRRRDHWLYLNKPSCRTVGFWTNPPVRPDKML